MRISRDEEAGLVVKWTQENFLLGLVAVAALFSITILYCIFDSCITFMRRGGYKQTPDDQEEETVTQGGSKRPSTASQLDPTIPRTVGQPDPVGLQPPKRKTSSGSTVGEFGPQKAPDQDRSRPRNKERAANPERPTRVSLAVTDSNGRAPRSRSRSNVGDNGEAGRSRSRSRSRGRSTDVPDGLNVPATGRPRKLSGSHMFIKVEETKNGPVCVGQSPVGSAVSLRKGSTPDAKQEKAGLLALKEADERGTDCACGEIQFSVVYGKTSRNLVVTVFRAKGLSAQDVNGKSDPYVVISVRPSTKQKHQTSVKFKQLDPRWMETFQFENFPSDELSKSMLMLEVFDYDSTKQDDEIGETKLDLIALQVRQEDGPLLVNKFLQPPGSFSIEKKGEPYFGELLISMCYEASRSNLQVVVMKAKVTAIMDGKDRAADPYCKVKVLQASNRAVITKQKTTIKKNCLNPVWNQNFSIPIEQGHHSAVSLEFVLMDHDMFSRNDLIGLVRFGADSSSKTAALHWEAVQKRPGQIVINWHKLYRC